MIKNDINKGGILTVTLLIGLTGVTFVLGFYNWAMDTNHYYKRGIAKTKAFYNAETGMARKAFQYLWQKDFIDGYSGLEGEKINKNMGSYLDPKFEYTSRGDRVASVYGVHEIRNSSGSTYLCSALVSLPARPQTLAAYMYLTASEEAGGAPFTFNGLNNRREVNFGSNDKLEGIVQTNGQLVVSDFGCPNFESAEVYLTNSTQIDLGGCDGYQELFGGWGETIDTSSKPPVKLPPVGYETLKSFANHIIDSDTKLFESDYIRDTLIMTDIEFKNNGDYRVVQWWYLMPPHLKTGSNSDNPNQDDLDLDDSGQCTVDCDQCYNGSNTCEIYETNGYRDFMASYYAKYINDSGNDNFLIYSSYTQPTTGPAGFHHFDVDQPPSNPLTGELSTAGNITLDQTFSGSDNTIIYIKDGPVRVHGTFKGRYSIVTDEYTLYNRHAWNPIEESPIDTVWNNIWITGDLINADALPYGDDLEENITVGNLRDLQPNADCALITQNIMGLVSGANIYIANTQQNGRVNQGTQGNIIINAALMALNESFSIQYWQSTTNSFIGNAYPLTNQTSHQPPWGDARGDNYGNTGDSDYRGYVYLWGGVVQKYRGYMKRNPTSPYGDATIGMDKSYHYDNNLQCNPPPFYPAIEFDDGSGEISIDISGYTSIF